MSLLVKISESCYVAAGDICLLEAEPQGFPDSYLVKLKNGLAMVIKTEGAMSPREEVERIVASVNTFFD